MTSKEATVFVVDLGSTMGERSHGRSQTNLEWSLEYIWDRLTTIVATGRKTNMAGVVGFRTDETSNALGHEEDYHHIVVFQEIGQVLMPQIRKLRNQLVVSGTERGDATSALITAIQMIGETCKKLQYIRRVVLVTDARAPIHTDDMAHITKKITDDKIELTVLGVDFDDAEYGFKEESKDDQKAEHEALYKTLCEDCNGIFGTLAQAINEMEIPRIKTVRPTPSYKGYLTLGNPAQYDTALTIDVERYPRVMKASAPTASAFVQRNGIAGSQVTQSTATLNGEAEENADGLTAVRSARTYQIVDDEAPGGKRDIPLDELSKGYEYGRTAVHISESDKNVTTLETLQALDIIGFVDKSQYQPSLDLTRPNLIVAQKGNEKASMALSSLIHALYELDSYAVARFVAKENKEPRLILLTPHIDPDHECLYDVELPFAEDMRSYRFPPLDRVVTVSGKQLTIHRNLPNDELQDAMDAYVDSMDLSTLGKDDEGAPAESMPMDETYNPKIHRINQVIKHRAVYPESDPPPAYDIITKFMHPPDELVKRSKSALNAIIIASQVKRVPPKARGKRAGRKDAPKPLSDLDVGALLAQDPSRKSKKIDPKNAIPEFRQIVENAVEMEAMHDACKQLKFIIIDWVRHSIGSSNHGRVLEAIGMMRSKMDDYDEPKPYNDFLKELKQKIFDGELSGDRKDMWYRLRTGKFTPITKRECQSSEFTEEQAKEFMLPR